MKKFTQEQLNQLPKSFKDKFPISENKINNLTTNPLTIKEYEALFDIQFEEVLALANLITQYEQAIIKLVETVDKYPKAVARFIQVRNSGDLNLKLKNSSDAGIKTAKRKQLTKLKEVVTDVFEEEKRPN